MTSFTRAVHCLERLVQDELANWPSEWLRFIYPGYVYEHTLRVRNLAVAIAQKEGANGQITELAALLHNLGKPGREPHTDTSARRAQAILPDLGFDRSTCGRVCHAIQTHLTDNPHHPIENQILRDADSIDANHGYVGYLRYIVIHAHRGETVAEIFANAGTWLAKRQERLERYNTPTARAIACGRFTRVQSFWERIGEDLRKHEKGIAFSIAQYVAADADYPSLFRQAQAMEDVVEGKLVIGNLGPSLFLEEFVGDLKREIAGQA